MQTQDSRTRVLNLPFRERDPASSFLYSLVARLLLARPDPSLVERLLGADRIIPRQPSALGTSWQHLVVVALLLGPGKAAEEYDALFVLPERPLRLAVPPHLASPLRSTDHLGTLCEMAGVMPDRREFFQRRIAPWYRTALRELQCAPQAHFYRHVAEFSRVFLDSEERIWRPTPLRHPPG
jgi:TorA maturation chaperone TorD